MSHYPLGPQLNHWDPTQTSTSDTEMEMDMEEEGSAQRYDVSDPEDVPELVLPPASIQ